MQTSSLQAATLPALHADVEPVLPMLAEQQKQLEKLEQQNEKLKLQNEKLEQQNAEMSEAIDSLSRDQEEMAEQVRAMAGWVRNAAMAGLFLLLLFLILKGVQILHGMSH